MHSIVSNDPDQISLLDCVFHAIPLARGYKFLTGSAFIYSHTLVEGLLLLIFCRA